MLGRGLSLWQRFAASSFLLSIAELEAYYNALSIDSADADPLATWPDLSSHGRNLLAAGGARPTYRAAGFHGVAGVEFDGLDDLMQSAPFGLTIPQPCTIICALQQDSASGNDRLVYDGLAPGARMTLDDVRTNALFPYAGAGFLAPPALTLNAPTIVMVEYTGASSTCARNGDVPITGNTSTNGIAGITIGGEYDGLYLWTGPVAAYALISRLLTASEKTRAWAELNSGFRGVY